MGRSRRKRKLRGVGIDRENKLRFKQAARDQRVCQRPGCGSAGAFNAHHVVYEQHLRPEGLPIYDTRNAMRLCVDCHDLHHKRRQVVPITALSEANIEFAFRAFGARAYDYLRRYYAGEDLRIELALAEAA